MYCSKLLKIVFGRGAPIPRPKDVVPLLIWCVNIRIMSCVCIYSISFYFCHNKLTRQILYVVIYFFCRDHPSFWRWPIIIKSNGPLGRGMPPRPENDFKQFTAVHFVCIFVVC
jgi:hypothetical protein